MSQGFVRRTLQPVKAFLKACPQLNPVNGDQLSSPLVPEIPLASVVEKNLQAYENRDWRSYFASKLNGKGLEIGPLHRPMVRHEGMDIDYIDRCTLEELRKHYPELSDSPLVEPTILGDAETLEGVGGDIYDFLIAAHVIEHMKNPLSALKHWVRVLKQGGKIYMLVPDKRVTFDKKRIRTSIPHMILDYQQPSTERDYEHYLDYAIHVHDKTFHEAIEEANRLVETDYSIHFHVFLPSDVIDLLGWFSEHIAPINIVEGPVMSPGSDEFHFLLEKR